MFDLSMFIIKFIFKFIGLSIGFSLAWFVTLAIIAIAKGESKTVHYKNCISVGVLLAVCYTIIKYSL